MAHCDWSHFHGGFPYRTYNNVRTVSPTASKLGMLTHVGKGRDLVVKDAPRGRGSSEPKIWGPMHVASSTAKKLGAVTHLGERRVYSDQRCTATHWGGPQCSQFLDPHTPTWYV